MGVQIKIPHTIHVRNRKTYFYMILRRYQKTLLKRSQHYCAYTRVYMRIDAILSLLTMFNIEMSNISNKAD